MIHAAPDEKTTAHSSVPRRWLLADAGVRPSLSPWTSRTTTSITLQRLKNLVNLKRTDAFEVVVRAANAIVGGSIYTQGEAAWRRRRSDRRRRFYIPDFPDKRLRAAAQR